MNIGFDAKRAFLNQSGLGNYSRMMIASLARFFPDERYFLFTPRSAMGNEDKNTSVVFPENYFEKKLNMLWRSYGITSLLSEKKIDVYHGLSNELPLNVAKWKGKKIVTIHDLIFRLYPKLYSPFDRKIYHRKVKSACANADFIVAVSEQTKADILEHYNENRQKIKVTYQSCADDFYNPVSEEKIKEVKRKYNLPGDYILYVGTIEERKNLLTVLKALALLKDIPLVAIGKKKKYFRSVKKYTDGNFKPGRILFPENISSSDLPAVYRGARLFVYPSLYEGFGIPILEALTCGTPVITSARGCFPEAGGPSSVYIDPLNAEQLAAEAERILSSEEIRKKMSAAGLEHAAKFRPEIIAGKLMELYKS